MPSDNSELLGYSVFYNSRRDDLLNDSSIKLPFQKKMFLKHFPFYLWISNIFANCVSVAFDVVYLGKILP